MKKSVILVMLSVLLFTQSISQAQDIDSYQLPP
ncbi:MAG: hypothetical protein RLZZ96_671, partial [Bacteroidota bacterium]